MGKRYVADFENRFHPVIVLAENYEFPDEGTTFTEAKRQVLESLQRDIDYLRMRQREIRKMRVKDVEE